MKILQSATLSKELADAAVSTIEIERAVKQSNRLYPHSKTWYGYR